MTSGAGALDDREAYDRRTDGGETDSDRLLMPFLQIIRIAGRARSIRCGFLGRGFPADDLLSPATVTGPIKVRQSTHGQVAKARVSVMVTAGLRSGLV